MVKGVGSNTVKFLVIVANFVVGLFGALIFGFSLYANLNASFSDHLKELITNAGGEDVTKIKDFSSVAWALCFFGAFVFLVGFIGCCGASTENRCLLGTYFIIVLVLTVIELGLTAVLLTNRKGIEHEVKKVISTSFNNNNETLAQIEKDIIEEKVLQLDCCGVKGTEATCAAVDKVGCADAVWDKIDSNLKWLGAICIIAVLVQIFAMVFACILCTAIGKRGSYEQHN